MILALSEGLLDLNETRRARRTKPGDRRVETRSAIIGGMPIHHPEATAYRLERAATARGRVQAGVEWPTWHEVLIRCRLRRKPAARV
jgi:hypothetical protein